jgi:uncharacterized protein
MKPARAILLTLITATSMAASLAVDAAQAAEFTRASVPVADRSEAVRSSAIVQGIDTVLVRLTGLRHPIADAIRSRASRYLLQYAYATREVPTLEDRSVSSPQLFLDMSFDGQALFHDIAAAGLPLWGGERPETLLWLIAEVEGGGREIAADGADTASVDAIYQIAEDRGIPVVLPLFDIEDQSLVTASDLWAAFEQPVREASIRYATDVVVTARVARIGQDRWEARWLRLAAPAPVTWVTEGETAELAIADGIEVLADDYASSFAVRAGEIASGLRVQVRGVMDLRDYARVLSYLERLTLVEQVTLVEASGDDLILAVVARGGRDALSHALTLSAMLTPADPVDPIDPMDRATGPDESAAILVFDLSP